MYLFFLLCILLHLSPVSLTGRNPSICFYVSDFIILGLILDSSPFFFFSLFYWVFLVTLRLQIGPLNINVIILFDYEAHHKAYYTW